MHETIVGLNDSRVTVFARLAFQHEGRFSGLAIFGYRDVERRPSLGSMVVDKQMPTVLESDSIRPGTRIGKFSERHVAPRLPEVIRRNLEQPAFSCATDSLQSL